MTRKFLYCLYAAFALLQSIQPMSAMQVEMVQHIAHEQYRLTCKVTATNEKEKASLSNPFGIMLYCPLSNSPGKPCYHDCQRLCLDHFCGQISCHANGTISKERQSVDALIRTYSIWSGHVHQQGKWYCAYAGIKSHPVTIQAGQNDKSLLDQQNNSESTPPPHSVIIEVASTPSKSDLHLNSPHQGTMIPSTQSISDSGDEIVLRLPAFYVACIVLSISVLINVYFLLHCCCLRTYIYRLKEDKKNSCCLTCFLCLFNMKSRKTESSTKIDDSGMMLPVVNANGKTCGHISVPVVYSSLKRNGSVTKHLDQAINLVNDCNRPVPISSNFESPDLFYYNHDSFRRMRNSEEHSNNYPDNNCCISNHINAFATPVRQHSYPMSANKKFLLNESSTAAGGGDNACGVLDHDLRLGLLNSDDNKSITTNNCMIFADETGESGSELSTCGLNTDLLMRRPMTVVTSSGFSCYWPNGISGFSSPPNISTNQHCMGSPFMAPSSAFNGFTGQHPGNSAMAPANTMTMQLNPHLGVITEHTTDIAAKMYNGR